MQKSGFILKTAVRMIPVATLALTGASSESARGHSTTRHVDFSCLHDGARIPLQAEVQNPTANLFGYLFPTERRRPVSILSKGEVCGSIFGLR
jgi:hypothetical protein